MGVWSQVQSPVAAGLPTAYTARSVYDTIAPLQLQCCRLWRFLMIGHKQKQLKLKLKLNLQRKSHAGRVAAMSSRMTEDAVCILCGWALAAR